LRRKTRNNFQFSNLRQPCDDLVLNAGGEIGVLWIATKVSEWKYGERLARQLSQSVLFIRSHIATEKKETNRKNCPDHYNVDPQCAARALVWCIRSFRPLDSLRRKFERSGKNQRYGKSDNEQQHHKTHSPIRNFEERKNLTRDLHEQPGHDAVRNRNFINVAPLQLSQDVLWIHFCAP
jgi:hypothetical protein